VQVCTSLQTDNHTSTSPLKFFTGRMPFLPPNQQRQSTEGTKFANNKDNICIICVLKFANNKDNICCQKPSQSYSTSYYNSGNTTTTTTLYPFNGLFSRITWVSWYQKGKTSLDLNEAGDDAVWGRSGISGNIIKQSAPRSVQITTPTPQHSIFYRPDALPGAQPTVSKH